MPVTPDVARARAAIAGRTRWHGADADLTGPTADLAKALAKARRDRKIAELVESAPPLTDEQIATIRRVFKYLPPDPADDAG